MVVAGKFPFPGMSRRSIKRIVLALAVYMPVSLLLASCSSSDPKVAKKKSGSELYRRLMSQERKSSMFDPERSKSITGESFRTKSIAGKDYRAKSFVGTKAHKTKPYIGSDKSNSWATRTARAGQEAVSSDLQGAYKTSQSRDASKAARGTSEGYKTGAYKTNSDVVGTKGIENAQQPKIIGRKDLSGLTEDQVRAMLGKQ